MSNQSARSFRTESALKRARLARSITCGSITIGRLPAPAPEPHVASVVWGEFSLPRYPGVLARTFEGGLCFAHEVPVIYLRGPSLLG